MLTRLRIAWLIAVLGIVAVPAAPALAQSSGDETEPAKKTQNPVADLISVPFQSNFNFGVGSKDATVYVLMGPWSDGTPETAQVRLRRPSWLDFPVEGVR